MTDLTGKLQIPNLLDWLTQEPPEPRWLIKDLLPEASLDMVSGPRKVALKTWFSMDMGITVATGVPSPGAPNKVEHDGKRVVFFEEEGTGHDTRSRIFKLLKGRGIDPRTGEGAEALKKLERNFLFWHHPRLKLDNPHWVSALCKFVESEKISLVVLDAITYMTSGDENSKQDMAPVNDALFSLRQIGAAVLYLVHTNKQSQREDADPDLDVRGSSVLLDAYDVHFALRRHAKEHINLLARYRDFEEARYKVTWEFKPDRVTGLLRAVTEESEELDKLKDLIPQLIPSVEYTPALIAKLFGMSSKTAGLVLNTLVKAGVLMPVSNGSFVKKVG